LPPNPLKGERAQLKEKPLAEKIAKGFLFYNSLFRGPGATSNTPLPKHIPDWLVANVPEHIPGYILALHKSPGGKRNGYRAKPIRRVPKQH